MPLMYTTNGLMKAAAGGDAALVAKFLKSDKDSWVAARDKTGRTALHAAAEKGHAAVARLLLDAGADIDLRDNYGSSPLGLAISSKHNGIVELLLQKGARTKGDGRNTPPLAIAAARNNLGAMDLLLAAKADPDEGQPLLTAAQFNNREAALKLVAAGAKIDVHDDYYRYPLHFAASTGSLDLARALLDAGADINLRDASNGYAPLHWAVIYGHNLVVELLMEKGARTDVAINNGQTPLELAYEKKNVAVIRLLEAAAKASAPAAAEAPPPAAPEDGENEKWLRMGASRAAHVGVYPEAGRRLTEIYNFQARERIVIAENLRTGQENMTQPESFDALDEELLQDALAAFRRLGGKADESRVLGSRGGKKPLKMP